MTPPPNQPYKCLSKFRAHNPTTANVEIQDRMPYFKKGKTFPFLQKLTCPFKKFPKSFRLLVPALS